MIEVVELIDPDFDKKEVGPMYALQYKGGRVAKVWDDFNHSRFKLGFEGDLDMKRIEGEVVNKLPRLVTYYKQEFSLGDGETRDKVGVFMATNDGDFMDIGEGGLSKGRPLRKEDDFQKYRDYLANLDRLAYILYEIETRRGLLEVGVENPSYLFDGGKSYGEITVAMDRGYHWNIAVMRWVLSHHADQEKLEGRVSPKDMVIAMQLIPFFRPNNKITE